MKRNIYKEHLLSILFSTRKVIMKKTLLFLVMILSVCVACHVPSQKAADEFYTGQTATAEEDIFALATAEAESTQAVYAQETQAASIAQTEAALIPPEPAPIFTTDLIESIDIPHTYVSDTCTLIKNRWGEGKAAPGTIVIVINYYQVVGAYYPYEDDSVKEQHHNKITNDLFDQGFTTITMNQFIGFMTNNDYIPERSALLIMDGQHPEEDYQMFFQHLYNDRQWTMVNAWPALDNSRADIINGNANAQSLGYVDHQSMGSSDIAMNDSTDDATLTKELQSSRDSITQNFGKAPNAIIWPKNSFGTRPIEFAKQSGYQIGFSSNPRGPVMYNWVPLADVVDPVRPELPVDGSFDPLFVIPRYKAADADQYIDTTRQIGKAAGEYLYEHRADEIRYYEANCQSTMGPL